jgi:hypothetical protein
MIRADTLRILMPAAALLLTAACDDSGGEERARKASATLSEYYYRAWKAPTPDWSVTKVRIGKDNAVTIDVTVSSEGASRIIMARSRFDQMEIARMGCPAIADTVWQEVDKKQSVGIALSGTAGHIMNAQCKRP